MACATSVLSVTTGTGKNQKPFCKTLLRSGLTLKYFMKNTCDTCARNVLELHLLC